jgi:hypothetical protein
LKSGDELGGFTTLWPGHDEIEGIDDLHLAPKRAGDADSLHSIEPRHILLKLGRFCDYIGVQPIALTALEFTKRCLDLRLNFRSDSFEIK